MNAEKDMKYGSHSLESHTRFKQNIDEDFAVVLFCKGHTFLSI